SDAPPFANELDRSNPRFRRLLSPDPGIPVNSLSGIECFRPPRGTTQMPGTIVPVLLALMFFGTLPARPHRQRWGYAARDVLGTAVLRAVFGLGALLVCGAASAQSVVGVTTANLQWAAASGPVAGYAVFIARNGAPYPARPTFTTSTTTAQVAGAYGDTITVKVAAFTTSGTYGPFSPDSAPITFVAAPPPGVVVQPRPEPGHLAVTENASGRSQGR